MGPRRRLAALSSSPMPSGMGSSSALRCTHLDPHIHTPHTADGPPARPIVSAHDDAAGHHRSGAQHPAGSQSQRPVHARRGDLAGTGMHGRGCVARTHAPASATGAGARSYCPVPFLFRAVARSRPRRAGVADERVRRLARGTFRTPIRARRGGGPADGLRRPGRDHFRPARSRRCASGRRLSVLLQLRRHVVRDRRGEATPAGHAFRYFRTRLVAQRAGLLAGRIDCRAVRS